MSKDLRFDRKNCDCENCPLNGRTKVRSTCGIPNPSIVLIGEAPGADEESGDTKFSYEDQRAFSQREKGPFIGASGGILKSALGQAGIMWHTVYRMNVINCRPTNNDIDSEDAQEAIKCCKGGFEDELQNLRKMGASVLVPVGNTALKALGVDGSISRSRGSVYSIERFGGVCIPTYHPSFILRGAIREEAVWVADLRKARDLSLKKWKPPKERFNIRPTLKDVRSFVSEAIKNKSLVACDIETDGGFSPDYNRITMIGLAVNGEEAIVIPFLRGGEHAREPYWTTGDEVAVRKDIQRLFDSCDTMFQNALFDVYQMAEKGLTVRKLKHDTMLLHHAIHPELPHDLGYIVSIYGSTPYWKDVTKGSKARMIEQDEDIIRIYNARDTVVLHQCLPDMLKDLKDVGTEKQYFDWSMKLVWPLVRMKMNGIKCDSKQVAKLKRTLEKEYHELDELLRSELDLPASFNFDSNFHLQYLLYGKKPPSLAKKYAEKDEIDASEKRSKTTKKYLELVSAIEPYEKVKPLYQSRSRARNCDAEALLSIQQAAAGRLESMDYLKRPAAQHAVERVAIERLLRFIELYSRFAEVSKMLGTYTNYPIAKDGRVHGDFKIHGTATGRLSASNPNLQNQPKSVRVIFVSEPGNVLIEGDYSNLELRVMAYVAGEPILIDAFEKGVKVHKVNCKLFWETDEDDPLWEKKYRVTKSVVFGTVYGGTAQGLYKRAMAEVPGLNVSFPTFEKRLNNFFARMEGYSKWAQTIREGVTGKLKNPPDWVGYRMTKNAFGRKRFYLGSPDEIERAALDTPIQGTAGDIANAAVVKLDAELLKKPELRAKICVLVHDSILVECPKENAQVVRKLMQKCMEQKYVINGIERSFPAEFKVGTNWYEMLEDDED